MSRDDDYMMPRKDAEQLLGVSDKQMIRFERAGKLRPHRRGRFVVYDPREVEEVLRTWRPARATKRELGRMAVESNSRADVAVAVFRALDEGWTPRRVVTTLGVEPALAQLLYQEWSANRWADPRADEERLRARERLEVEELRAQDAHERRMAREDAVAEREHRRRVAALMNGGRRGRVEGVERGGRVPALRVQPLAPGGGLASRGEQGGRAEVQLEGDREGDGGEPVGHALQGVAGG